MEEWKERERDRWTEDGRRQRGAVHEGHRWEEEEERQRQAVAVECQERSEEEEVWQEVVTLVSGRSRGALRVRQRLLTAQLAVWDMREE